MEAYSDADALLAKAGDFGPYQWLLMALFSLVNVASSFHYFSQTFISIAPEHWCNASEFRHLRVLDETTAAKIRHYLRKLPDRGCYRYDWSPEEEPSFPNLPEDGYPPVVLCDRGWIYNRDSGFETAVSELDWVCEDDWKPAAGQSAFFAGSIVGSLVLGFLSDRKGRLPALCAANFMAFAGSVATAFTTTLPLFALSRFISGTATDCNFVMMYIIVMEYVRPEMRTFGLNLCIGVFYCLGCVTVPLIAVALGSWRLFLLVTSAPLAVVVCYYYVFLLTVAFLAAPALCQHGGLQQYQTGGQHYQTQQAQPQHYQAQPAQPQHYQVQQAQPQHYQVQKQAQYQHEPEHYDEHPKYEYSYKVEDEHTGDYKEQQETRDGDVVKGFYWLIDADGYKRMVEYTVEGKSGFQAKVTREPTGHAPAPAQPRHQPQAQQHQPQPQQHQPQQHQYQQQASQPQYQYVHQPQPQQQAHASYHH